MSKAKAPCFYNPPPDHLEGCAPEQALCYDFIDEALIHGWKVLPEYPDSTFDMLLVAEEGCTTTGVEPGTQVGVQAKMSLNHGLMSQLTRSTRFLNWAGPDYVVGLIPGPPRTKMEKGMEEIMHTTGHGLFYVYSYFESHEPGGYLRRSNLECLTHFGVKRKFIKRLKLPNINFWCEPGVRSPSPVTEWKIKAVTFCMELEKAGGMTRKQIQEYRPKINTQTWVKEGWIIPSGEKVGRGQVYILNPESKDRPDLLNPDLRKEVERVRGR